MKPDYSLYYILDLPAGRGPLELAMAAASGGASVIQLRGKESSASDLYGLAVALKERLSPLGVALIINDRLDVALAAGADGVHVGDDDLPFERVRQLAPDLILGVSCYGDLQRAESAAVSGTDYLAFGAFYPSPSKPGAKPAPVSVLGEALRCGLPVIAIGGIKLDNVEELVRAGADGVSVISAIQYADDPKRAARDLRAAIERASGRASR